MHGKQIGNKCKKNMANKYETETRNIWQADKNAVNGNACQTKKEIQTGNT